MAPPKGDRGSPCPGSLLSRSSLSAREGEGCERGARGLPETHQGLPWAPPAGPSGLSSGEDPDFLEDNAENLAAGARTPFSPPLSPPPSPPLSPAPPPPLSPSHSPLQCSGLPVLALMLPPGVALVPAGMPLVCPASPRCHCPLGRAQGLLPDAVSVPAPLKEGGVREKELPLASLSRPTLPPPPPLSLSLSSLPASGRNPRPSAALPVSAARGDPVLVPVAGRLMVAAARNAFMPAPEAEAELVIGLATGLVAGGPMEAELGRKGEGRVEGMKPENVSMAESLKLRRADKAWVVAPSPPSPQPLPACGEASGVPWSHRGQVDPSLNRLKERKQEKKGIGDTRGRTAHHIIGTLSAAQHPSMYSSE